MNHSYHEICKRLQRGRKERITDAQIIEELDEEIERYREKIQMLTNHKITSEADLIPNGQPEFTVSFVTDNYEKYKAVRMLCSAMHDADKPAKPLPKLWHRFLPPKNSGAYLVMLEDDDEASLLHWDSERREWTDDYGLFFERDSVKYWRVLPDPPEEP